MTPISIFHRPQKFFILQKSHLFLRSNATKSPQQDDVGRIYEDSKKRSIYCKSDRSLFHTEFYHANDQNVNQINYLIM